jgi:hypothetical protein
MHAGFTGTQIDRSDGEVVDETEKPVRKKINRIPAGSGIAVAALE